MPRVAGISAAKLPTDYDVLVRMHPLCAIHDEVGYGNAQELIDALTCMPRLTKGQSQYLDALSVLFESYENEHHAIDVSKLGGPLEVLKALMQENDMNASDLGRLLGERSLGPKILSGARDLSKSHVRTLAAHFKLSADLFL